MIRKPATLFHELRCSNTECKQLIGFIRQTYYIKHKYLCINCYMRQIREDVELG